ncbi:hypothetical protein E2C01_034160 [Portunus trituberculatus]|uniref:Uncharacterized protein n=1 Tax=Portunus trituberculatus TaxID=210409 RepID=A0A5B7F664_PORTR|nr:hypothetical protein [Portunus trituberculatus]
MSGAVASDLLVAVQQPTTRGLSSLGGRYRDDGPCMGEVVYFMPQCPAWVHGLVMGYTGGGGPNPPLDCVAAG